MQWGLRENADVLVFERVSKKLGIVPTCGCLKMKLPPLGPQFICLAIRRHTSQIMRIRLDGLAGMGDFHVGCCEDECSRLASGWTQMTVASCHEFGPGLSRYHSQLQLKNTETFFHWMPFEADETWQNIYPTPNVSKSSHHSCPNALETCRDFVSCCHAQSSWQICAFTVSWRFFTNPVAALRFVLDFPGVRFGTHILGC